MGLELAYDYGATPLSAEEKEGLRIKSITTQGELNEMEAANIAKAHKWAFSRAHRDLLSERFALRLHRNMFGSVWQWAGKYRLTEKNIGVRPFEIAVQLRNLIEDVKMWIPANAYSPKEMAARLHHRMVYIHPFANGNGRHARLFVDIFMHQNGFDPLTWGNHLNEKPREIRRRYIDALREADGRRMAPLIAFIAPF